MKNFMKMTLVVGSLLVCTGASADNNDLIIENKAPILNITACSTYDVGCKRLAEQNNKGKIIKDKAFRVDEDKFAISVDDYMVLIKFNDEENKLEYIGISDVEGFKDLEGKKYSLYNSFIPEHLKEDKSEEKDINSNSEPGNIIVIDGISKTDEEWKLLEDKFNDERYSKGIPSEEISEHEAMIKYQEQVNNPVGGVNGGEEVIIE